MVIIGMDGSRRAGIGCQTSDVSKTSEVLSGWLSMSKGSGKQGAGTTFAIASHMLSEGMRDQAFHTARGVYNVVWKDRGYFFRTPEAYDARGMFRASMYMRPGAIWSMEMALK